MTIDDKDIELLKLRIELLEQKVKNKDAEITERDRLLLDLSHKLDEPAPIVGMPPKPQGKAELKTILESLSPAELIILCKQKGIKIEEIFPL